VPEASTQACIWNRQHRCEDRPSQPISTESRLSRQKTRRNSVLDLRLARKVEVLHLHGRHIARKAAVCARPLGGQRLDMAQNSWQGVGESQIVDRLCDNAILNEEKPVAGQSGQQAFTGTDDIQGSCLCNNKLKTPWKQEILSAVSALSGPTPDYLASQPPSTAMV